MTANHTARYLILGAGRQGTAAAYDLARFEQAAHIVMADADPAAAQQAAERVNQLIGRDMAVSLQLDATHREALVDALRGVDVALSAVPYYFNVAITEAAIEAGTHLCDLGGNTDVVREQTTYHDAARDAGVSILPDCGMGPGLVNTLSVYAMELLDETREVYIYDGGLPQHPEPPWNYQLTFHINGLTNEYDGMVPLIRDGRIVEVEALSECQMIDLSPLGVFETFIAAGGSTGPWTFEGLLQTFETRIMRYPGHYAWFKAFKTLGLFSEEPLQVGGQTVIPREVYHALLSPHIVKPGIIDICRMRAKGVGSKDGSEAIVLIDVVDRYDTETGFTGMERLTGWHASIMMGFQMRGTVPQGCKPLEQLHLESAPSAGAVMDALALRGIAFSSQFEPPA